MSSSAQLLSQFQCQIKPLAMSLQTGVQLDTFYQCWRLDSLSLRGASGRGRSEGHLSRWSVLAARLRLSSDRRKRGSKNQKQSQDDLPNCHHRQNQNGGIKIAWREMRQSWLLLR